MPRSWIYFTALFLLLFVRVLLLDMNFVSDWLWYNGYEAEYYLLANLRQEPQLARFFGGWALPLFVIAVITYWLAAREQDDDNLPAQFALLPIAYVPFCMVGEMLRTLSFDVSMLYIYPLVLIPAGYLYLFPWLVFVWVFSKLRLILD